MTYKSVNGLASKLCFALSNTYLAAYSFGVMSSWAFSKNILVIKANKANSKGIIYLHQSNPVKESIPLLTGYGV